MLEKMKSTADNARDKSFAMDHVKSELEVSFLIVIVIIIYLFI